MDILLILQQYANQAMSAEIIKVIQQYVNMLAVIAAVVATQGLKRLLPNDPEGSSTSVEPGKWWTRCLPFFPVLFGIGFCLLIEKDASFTFADGVRGFMSGALAAYLYRTSAVTIFGK